LSQHLKPFEGLQNKNCSAPSIHARIFNLSRYFRKTWARWGRETMKKSQIY